MPLDLRRLPPDNFCAGIVALLCYAAIASATALHAQNAAPSASRDVHIEIIVAPGSAHLTKRDFTASQAGKSYGITASHPSPLNGIPTHLLIVLADQPQSSARVLGDLHPLLARGWQISIVRPDGYATPYLSDKTALATALLQSGTSIEYIAALRELAGFVGRRVLILEKLAIGTNAQMLLMGSALIPETYSVDGGFLGRHRNLEPDPGGFSLPNPTIDLISTCQPITTTGRPGGPEGDCVPATPMKADWPEKRRMANGVTHEVNFEKAVKDALHDARDYYDLDFKAPALTAPDPLIVTLCRMAPFSTSVTLYASNISNESLRTPAPPQMILKEN